MLAQKSRVCGRSSWLEEMSGMTLQRLLMVSLCLSPSLLTFRSEGDVADEHTEDLLSQHEHEIARLKAEVRLKMPLLTSIRKYIEICQEEKELERVAGDQTRLLGRGGGRDPGRLLREEKMRKRVGKEKPKV